MSERLRPRERLLTPAWACFYLLLAGVLLGLWTPHHLPWTDWLTAGNGALDWFRLQLAVVDESSPLVWVLFPSLLMLAFSGVLLLLFDRPPNWVRPPVAVVFLTLQAGYIGFRIFATLNLDSAAVTIFSTLFLVSEVAYHLRLAISIVTQLHVTDRSAQADESERAVRAGEYLPQVDVFIPTYSESVELLERSIIGCQAMDYPNKTVWLLDDQRRPAMRALAAKLGCRYLDRPNNLHAKAGNLNAALARTRGELILCFDADFIPTRNFLQRTVGFFRDAKVALVQTPQNFYNDDAPTRNLGLKRGHHEEQRLFFRAVQPSRDAANAIICHGSCFVARRTSLEEIGGIPTETITEDWATSIKLQAAGFKSYYLNEALSAGLAADTSGEFIQQRVRWAQGTLQAIFASTNPLRVRGLTWIQRIYHATGILHYLASLTTLLSLVIPLFFLFGGMNILQASVAQILFFRLPFTLGCSALFSWLMLGTRSVFWTEFYASFLAPSTALITVRALFKPKGAIFRVTDKAAHISRSTLNRRVAFPFAVLLLLHIAGLAVTVCATDALRDPVHCFTLAYLTVTNVAVLWMCLLASIDVPHRSRFAHFDHRLPCKLMWEGGEACTETLQLSHGDASIPRASLSGKLPSMAWLSLPSLGLLDLAVCIRENTHEKRLYCEFVDLSLPRRRTLVEFLYCRPGQWSYEPTSEPRSLWEYATTPLRMYPLADAR